MIRKSITLAAILLVSCMAWAQQEPVLLRVNGRNFLRSEFEYFYRKMVTENGLDAAWVSPEDCLDSFVTHKLMVLSAEEMKLDTMPVFRMRLSDYRCHLYLHGMFGEAGANLVTSASRQTNARKPSEQVYVWQICKRLPQNITSEALLRAEQQMDSIYQCLKEGVSFETCVNTCSDKRHAQWLTRLQMTEAFERETFSLQPGEVSKPFFTPQGIHIIKVLERRTATTLPNTNTDGERADASWMFSASTLSTDAEECLQQLKEKYAYLPVKAAVDELLQTGRSDKTLFTLNGTPYTGGDFCLFVSGHPGSVKRQLELFIRKSILDFGSSRFMQENPHYCWQLQMFRDSLLTAEVIGRNVAGRADEAALKDYFEKHRSDYRWESPRYKGAVLHCATKQVAKHARKFLKKIPYNEWRNAIRLTFEVSMPGQVLMEQGLFAAGDNVYVDALVFKKSENMPPASLPFTVVVGKKIKEPTEYCEADERLSADFEHYLTDNWLKVLRLSAKVEINQEVLKTVNNH